MGTDQHDSKADEVRVDATGGDESSRDGQLGQLSDKTRSILGDAADWASDRLKDVSERLAKPPVPSGDVEVEVAHQPPAPVTGDAGARAAGKVKDDITEADDDAIQGADVTH